MKTTAKYLDKVNQVNDQPESHLQNLPENTGKLHDRELVLMRIRHILRTAQQAIQP